MRCLFSILMCSPPGLYIPACGVWFCSGGVVSAHTSSCPRLPRLMSTCGILVLWSLGAAVRAFIRTPCPLAVLSHRAARGDRRVVPVYGQRHTVRCVRCGRRTARGGERDRRAPAAKRVPARPVPCRRTDCFSLRGVRGRSWGRSTQPRPRLRRGGARGGCAFCGCRRSIGVAGMSRLPYRHSQPCHGDGLGRLVCRFCVRAR